MCCDDVLKVQGAVRGFTSHHLSDRETVPEVVEWVVAIVLLHLQLRGPWGRGREKRF